MVSGTAELAVETATDGALLGRFANTRDEAAFAELVKRHGRLVWGVCRRRLARREDAEDAFQAAFLILAVKAHAIHSADALPGWLHRTACRAAFRVASASPVEATHDVPTDSLDAFAEVARREAATAIDEELVRLPERYRNAVVLFHLEGLERRDVAERLGISEPTVKALLSRGRALLRTRLARRGLALPMVLPLAVDPVPAAVMETTCRLALSLTRAGLTPLDLVTLPAKGFQPMTALLSNKAVAATLVGAACLTLFLATRGDANASGEGQNQRSVITTVFDPSRTVEPTPVLLADAELLATAAEEPAPADVKEEEAPAAGLPEVPLDRPQKVPQTASEVKIREALNEDTELSFPNTPLRDALQYLADIHEINIIIDEQALEEDGLSVDDNVDIVLSGITLRSALNILLERYDLTYVIEDEVMKITTQSKAERTVSTRVYDVSSLVGEGGSAAEVAAAVERLLEETPMSAASNKDAAEQPSDGLPRPRIVPFGDRLIVKATAADLKEIEEILDLMSLGGKKASGSFPATYLDSTAAKPAVNNAGIKIFSLENAQAAGAAKILQDALPSNPTQPKLQIAVDQRTNSIIASGTEEQLKTAEAVLMRLDETDVSPKKRSSASNAATVTKEIAPPTGEPPRPTITLDEPMTEIVGSKTKLTVSGRVSGVAAETPLEIRLSAVGSDGKLAPWSVAQPKVMEDGRFSMVFDNGWPRDEILVTAHLDRMPQIEARREMGVVAEKAGQFSILEKLFVSPPSKSDAVADFDNPSPVEVASGTRFVVRGTVPVDTLKGVERALQSAPPEYDVRLYPKGGNPRLTPGRQQPIMLLPYGELWWFETDVLATVPPGQYVLRYGRVDGPREGPEVPVTVTEPAKSNAAEAQ